MSLVPPYGRSGVSASEAAFDVLGHEVLAEKAAALGRAGEKALACLARLREDCGEGGGESAGENAKLRQRLLQEAADAVHAWFIQRELCGLRRHEAAIRDFGIPREVLARLGAR